MQLYECQICHLLRLLFTIIMLVSHSVLVYPRCVTQILSFPFNERVLPCLEHLKLFHHSNWTETKITMILLTAGQSAKWLLYHHHVSVQRPFIQLCPLLWINCLLVTAFFLLRSFFVCACAHLYIIVGVCQHTTESERMNECVLFISVQIQTFATFVRIHQEEFVREGSIDSHCDRKKTN